MEYFFETEFDIEVAKVRYQLDLHLKQLKEEFKAINLEEEHFKLRDFISDIDKFYNKIYTSLEGIQSEQQFEWVVDGLQDDFHEKHAWYFLDSGREIDHHREGDAIKLGNSFFKKIRECLIESRISAREVVERLTFENLLEINPDNRIETLNKFYLTLKTKPERLRIINGLRLRVKSHCSHIRMTEIERLQFDKLDIFLKSCLEVNRIVLLGGVVAKTGVSKEAKRDNYKQLLQDFLDPYLIIDPFDNFLASEIVLFRSDILRPRLKYYIQPRNKWHPQEVVQRLRDLQTQGFIVGGDEQSSKIKSEELKWWIFSLLGHHPGYSYDSIHKAFYQ